LNQSTKPIAAVLLTGESTARASGLVADYRRATRRVSKTVAT
jgi:hypothetical protein